MSTQKQIIFWITRRPARFEAQRFSSLCHLLAQQGYQVRWIEIPSALPSSEIELWLPEKLDAPCCAIFFADKEVQWPKPLIGLIRTKTVSPIRYVATFWIYEDVD